MSCDLGRYDICVRNGDTADEHFFQFEDEQRNIIPIAGFQFFMEIRNQKGEKVERWSTANQRLSIENGEALILNKIKKVSMEPGEYTYAIKMQEDDDLYTFITGNYTVQPEKVDEDA